MALEIEEIELDDQGYSKHGTYFGIGKRIFTCDEVMDLRELTQVEYRESDACRADDIDHARMIFEARIEAMKRWPKTRMYCGSALGNHSP